MVEPWLAEIEPTADPPLELKETVYVFTVHFAWRVMLSVILSPAEPNVNGLVKAESLNQPAKEYPALIGSAGLSMVAP